ncbi:hypothetical protein [Leptolyngbya ohadii]|uniref:hypothetical protein n=1 Tax=Leptolyngbya ohadii TaxID=1962290 RepID=UPI0015C64A0B|nr:hypothetical protein [Leptolyngbya ohadii]
MSASYPPIMDEQGNGELWFAPQPQSGQAQDRERSAPHSIHDYCVLLLTPGTA